MISVLNNVSSLVAENALSSTQTSLQNTLQQLSTGLRINSGSNDPAGLSIANGLGANIAALTQSSQNASNGVGLLQTADGALSQVTTLLNQAVSIATEAANGGLTAAQSTAANTEFTSILTEIGQIGSTTNFNGEAVFSTTAQTVYTGDGTSGGATTTSTTTGTVSATSLNLQWTAAQVTAEGAMTIPDTTAPTAGTNLDITTSNDAKIALTAITAAISQVAASRGSIGASVNQLTADEGVQTTEVQNLTSAQNNVQNADIGTTVSHMTQYNVLEQTGMAALSQSNSAQQSVLKLLQ